MGKTSNQLNRRRPGNFLVAINQAVDTPIIVVKIATITSRAIVLVRYPSRTVLRRWVQTSVEGEKRDNTTISIGSAMGIAISKVPTDQIKEDERFFLIGCTLHSTCLIRNTG